MYPTSYRVYSYMIHAAFVGKGAQKPKLPSARQKRQVVGVYRLECRGEERNIPKHQRLHVKYPNITPKP